MGYIRNIQFPNETLFFGAAWKEFQLHPKRLKDYGLSPLDVKNRKPPADNVKNRKPPAVTISPSPVNKTLKFFN